MITNLYIDALVASKADLYRSVEHFKYLDQEKLNLSIRDEIESLVELASPEICLKRCDHFAIVDVKAKDYEERIIDLGNDLFILAGIRFQGLDVTKPYVSVIGNFKEISIIPFKDIAELVRESFKVFKPYSYHISFPEGLIVPNDHKIDRYTVMGNIQDIVKLTLPVIPDQVELIPMKSMNFYDEYVNEYEKLYLIAPHLKNEVKIESLETLNEAGNEDLLFEIVINGNRAGVIAGYTEDYFGKKEICILEKLLFESFRRKGFGVYLQKEFALKMLNRFDLMWGHISDLNPSSLKTALKNGRKVTEIEYSFSLNKIEALKASHDDHDQIYMMGFDIWSEGSTKSDYLNLCRNSPKYKMGQWFVLKDDSQLLSSLIVYKLDENVFGIGSISTPVLLRKKGYASQLISLITEFLESELNASAILLYSDINSKFYKTFGFEKLPKAHQRYKDSICMIRVQDLNQFLSSEIKIPEYF